jgi:ABC-2 type transport system ATP-binding protein
MASLEVKKLGKSFSGSPVLTEVGFALLQGEILGLIGPNGSGKTTLLESVAGLLPPDSGDFLWNEAPLPLDARKDILFYMPESVLPYGDQRVDEVIHFFSKVLHADCSIVPFLLENLGLFSALEKRVSALSKGYRRRLLIALALLSPKPILFLDEPFDGLDLKQALCVMSLLKEMKSRGKTFLLAIHQLSDAEKICDRFLLLSEGKVLALGTLEELRRKTNGQAKTLEEVFLALT